MARADATENFLNSFEKRQKLVKRLCTFLRHADIIKEYHLLVPYEKEHCYAK